MGLAANSVRDSVQRLAIDSLDQVYAIMEQACAPGTLPPDYPLSKQFVTELFEGSFAQDQHEVGVFGVYGGSGSMAGIIALQPLSLDSGHCLEFMIFFHPNAREPGLAVAAARRVIDQARSASNLDIVTLVYPPNDRAKRFYEKANFRYERPVECEGYSLELWRCQS
jgi:RimJ/RimL family protein N-acetyltransferase